jgi:hypothetical protein
MHPLLDSVPDGNLLLLDAEGGACYQYREADCRMILAVGQELDKVTDAPVARVGVVLREETLALLWACRLTRGQLEARPSSPLFHLPCHWVPRANSADDEEGVSTGREGGPLPVLRLLDDLLLLKPESAVALGVGDNQDDARWLIALVGLDERDGQKKAILFQEWWLVRLWQAMLMGAGACFSMPGSPLEDAFPKEVGEEEKDDE